MRARLKRVIAETGLRGLVVRGVARTMISVSERLGNVGYQLISSMPPALLTTAADRRRLRRNKALEGRHRGERCFILGNGPSLLDEDLSLLKGHSIMTVNKGHLFARRNGLVPTYHCCVDPFFLDQKFDELFRDWGRFQKETGATFLLSTQIGDHFETIVPEVDYFAVKQFLKSTYFDRSDKAVPIDLCLVQPGYLSVVHFAIVLALYLGYSEICLVGCDMDFFVNPDSALLHAYDDDEMPAEAPSATEAFGWDQVDLMAWCTDEFRAFRALRKLGESKGCLIVNSGRNGALNVFPRESLELVSQRKMNRPE